jgi:hypothetical protein
VVDPAPRQLLGTLPGNARAFQHGEILFPERRAEDVMLGLGAAIGISLGHGFSFVDWFYRI